MALTEYAFLLKPTLLALGTLAREIRAAKGNDGKITAKELGVALGKMTETLRKELLSLVRDKDENTT